MDSSFPPLGSGFCSLTWSRFDRVNVPITVCGTKGGFTKTLDIMSSRFPLWDIDVVDITLNIDISPPN